MLVQKAFRRAGYDLRRIHTTSPEIWIDVGAHLGETTFESAAGNPGLLVFAFEPNWDIARRMMGKAANYIVLPMAVSDTDGVATFYVNTEDGSSSLLKLMVEGVPESKREAARVKAEVLVPTIRLDTFLRQMNLESVDYLKVDSEGMDLRIIQSAGDRLKDIKKIKTEVELGEGHGYHGQSSRDEMISFLESHGFKLTSAEKQNEDRQENLTFQAGL